MAQIIINTTAAQDVRLTHCFGVYLQFDPPRDATGAEVKHAITDFMQNVVNTIERQEKKSEHDAQFVPPDPVNIIG